MMPYRVVLSIDGEHESEPGARQVAIHVETHS